MSKTALQTEIDAANKELSSAEGHLAAALKGLGRLSKAEKTKITKGVEEAFSRLKVARQALNNLGTILSKDKKDG